MQARVGQKYSCSSLTMGYGYIKFLTWSNDEGQCWHRGRFWHFAPWREMLSVWRFKLVAKTSWTAVFPWRRVLCSCTVATQPDSSQVGYNHLSCNVSRKKNWFTDPASMKSNILGLRIPWSTVLIRIQNTSIYLYDNNLAHCSCQNNLILGCYGIPPTQSWM